MKFSPAFPIPHHYTPEGEPISEGHPGMEMRDYFAASIAGGDWSPGSDHGWSSDISDDRLLDRARLYYRMADAMVKASLE